MKPTLVADEMFPDGAGSYIELEEVIVLLLRLYLHLSLTVDLILFVK